MMPPGTDSASRARCSPTRRFRSSFSSTQGPAMRKSASRRKCGGTSVRGFNEGGGVLLAGLTAMPFHRCRDEPRKKRMRTRGPRLQFRMELAADEPRMVRQFHNLDELPIRRKSTQPEPMLHEEVSISIRDFISMPMPLADLGLAV